MDIKKQKSTLRKNDMYWGYLFIAPTLLGLLIFYIFPVFQTFFYSFNDWGDFGSYSWSGLENYEEMFANPEIWDSFRNTLIYAFVMVPISIAISIIVAVLLNQKIKGLTFYRTLFFLLVVTMPAAIGMIWKWLYNADYGIINHILGWFSIPGPDWLTDPNWVLISIIIVGTWGAIGTNMVILLSGLQGIPKSLYEAASLDGAGSTYSFFKITLPLLSPTIFFVAVISFISAFQVFDFIFMMVSPTNPAIDSAQSVIYLFYHYAFVIGEKGIAAAIAFVLFLVILVLTILQFRLQKRWVHYE
ncbi:Lactose transport system permease protein LacF [Virgibacillus salexigens]|uniref:Lactose transport system permease protein LacF n=2 Tax=Virgibacillus massiliensis TaxID=1462526 RepID=A0A024Q7E7_9BACI|nr:sugar ABC transporter permease [Virgibacillus massiliensis]CDQ38438.1 Lactose transport system permease protein LacF [Virgibacillus massiliensis]